GSTRDHTRRIRMTDRVVVIGGGIGGAVASLQLAKAGRDVVLLERGNELGGLVVSFEIGGTPLERAFHHLIPGEPHILELLKELDLYGRVSWQPSSVAMLERGRVWPFTSPLDLLRFSPLPFFDRIRMGLGALRFARIEDWEPLDREPAVDWLRRLTSPKAVEVVWEPLLRVKFDRAATNVPASWMWARFRARAGGRKRGREYLGYLRGGFRQMFGALAQRLTEAGVDVRLGSAAKAIAVDGRRAIGIDLGGEQLEADSVLFCGPLPALPSLVPEALRDQRWVDAKGLGVVCVVIEMTRPASDVYWVNVTDPDIGMGGFIEHTNLVPPSDYGGKHLAYMSRYYLQDEPIASVPPEQTAEIWLDQLEDRMPGFSRSNVTAVHPFRAPYAAPLVGLGYRSTIPPIRSHIDGLYVCTTAQIYPQDRGMSEGVRLALDAAATMLAGDPLLRNGA
ncbi:MAG: NAD(P)/FAD-dependent oxidoreductase, partial [Actinomycetota bacterium]